MQISDRVDKREQDPSIGGGGGGGVVGEAIKQETQMSLTMLYLLEMMLFTYWPMQLWPKE